MNTLRSVVVSIFLALLSVAIPTFALMLGKPEISFFSCLFILLVISIFIFKNKNIKYIKIAFIGFLSVCLLMVSLNLEYLGNIISIANFDFGNYLSFWIGSVWTGIVFITMQEKINEIKQNQETKN